MRKEEVLILDREDLNESELRNFQRIMNSKNLFQENSIILFIDNNGETKILKNTYGNDNLENRIDWIKFSELQPKSKQKVYILLENERGNLFQTMGIYIAKRTVLAENFIDEDSDFYDYEEETDTYWTPEGFYEWSYSSEINMYISEKVVYWHPLFVTKHLKR